MAIDFLKTAAINVAEGYVRIAFNGLDEDKHYPVDLSHFIPCNSWIVEGDGLYVVDQSNGDKYFNDSPRVKRLKCLAIAAATPITHAIGTVLNVANRIVKLVTLSHFWYPSDREDDSFSKRLFAFSKDVMRVALAPILYVGFELSAIYGLILPNDGGKLFATFERCAFGGALLAPCFQPEPSGHLGGGDLELPDQW